MNERVVFEVHGKYRTNCEELKQRDLNVIPRCCPEQYMAAV